MPVNKEEQYEQDRLGNVRRKIDTLRAQSGMWGEDTGDGIAEIGSAETGAVQLLYSLPTHAQQAILIEVHAHNSATTSGNYELYEVDLDGSGNITASTRRSVPINVDNTQTRIHSYEGLPFSKSIGVQSEFAGMIGVGVIDDHHEENEPASEQTQAP